MSSVISLGINRPETSSQLLNSIEFQDYLLYENAATEALTETLKNAPTSPTGQNIEDIQIPQRSPRRPLRSKCDFADIRGKQNVSASPCSVLDSSSFEYRNDDSEKSSTESIFSDDEIAVYEENVTLDEFGLDLSGIDDMELFLSEIYTDENGPSDIIFEVDDVVNIVAIHSGSDIRPISYIDVN